MDGKSQKGKYYELRLQSIFLRRVNGKISLVNSWIILVSLHLCLQRYWFVSGNYGKKRSLFNVIIEVSITSMGKEAISLLGSTMLEIASR